MALNANALTSILKVKEQLEIPALDLTQDGYIERLINAASQQIETYCDRKIKSTTQTKIYDGSGANELILLCPPIISITSVNFDYERVFDSNSLLTANDYALVDDFVLRKHSGSWGRVSQSVKVVFVAGFAVVPADIEDACILLCEYRYRLRNDRRLGRTSQSKQNEQISYTKDWPSEIYSLLENYKNIGIFNQTFARYT